MFFGANYFIYMIPAFILSLGAQWYVKSSYNKWNRVMSRSRMTGAEAVQRLMRTAGLYNINIEPVRGKLSDHYDPRTKTLRLSEDNYRGTSVAALAVAAHEFGHALQDKHGYAPLKLRSAMVPAVNIGSNLGIILILIGLFLNFTGLAWLGIIIFSAGAAFALVTLPVEFDASKRAKQLLLESGIVTHEDEARGVNTVLNAAALTYVAALITAVLQVLYYASLLTGRRD